MPPSRRHAPLLLTLALCLVASACDPGDGGTDAGPGDGGDPPVDAGPPTLELGTGEGIFRSIADGETLDLVSGCQGAQHVWVALRAWSIERRGTLIDLALTDVATGEKVSQVFQVVVSMQPVDGAVFVELTGLTLVVPDPDLALDRDLRLSAVVEDMNGIEISDERSIRVAWGEGGCR